MPDLRKPVVAGQFYPSGLKELNKQIESFIDKKVTASDYLACMLPHAGYIYSGQVAAKTVSRVIIKDKIILIGPNHTGNGVPFSVQTEGIWQTPLGEIKIDTDLAEGLLARSKYLKKDSDAHIYEHSLEVELPFLQYFNKNFQIVPLCILSDDTLVLKEIGESIAATVKELHLESQVLVVASSDMTHYEPEAMANKKDKEAIAAILNLDAEKLTEKVQGLNITMCGYAPVLVMLAYVKALGAKKGELVSYQTSGDVTGDKESVVGYAGITIS